MIGAPFPLLCGLGLYLASFGPAAWYAYNIRGTRGTTPDGLLFYAPLYDLADSDPTAQTILKGYCDIIGVPNSLLETIEWHTGPIPEGEEIIIGPLFSDGEPIP